MTMLTRRHAIGAGAAALALPAFAKPRLHYGLKPIPVADGLWMLEGATDYFSFENGGDIVNCCFFETDAGAVIVDTGPSLRYGEELREVILQTIGRGIAQVIMTHHHPDHFFGNQAFGETPIAALGQTAALARAEGDAFSDNMYRLLGDWMRGTEVVPPTTTLAPGGLTIGGRDFEALPLAGHTGADLALLDRRTGVVVAGDLAFLDRAPTTPHADLPEWHNSLDVLEALRFSAILPGHGPFDPEGASLRQTRDYLNWLDEALRAAANEGFDMMEIMAQPLPERFASMGAQPQEFQRSIAHLYPQYELAAMPRVDTGAE